MRPVPANATRVFLAFLHIPKMGGTTVRKLFCELRAGRWACPYHYCASPLLVKRQLDAGEAAWARAGRRVFLEQHCVEDFTRSVRLLGVLRAPLARAGWRLVTASLLRAPVPTSISWFHFFARTQGPRLTLEQFARLRPDFVLAGLLGAFDQPPALPRPHGARVRAEHGAWQGSVRLVKLAQGPSNLALQALPQPLMRDTRNLARSFAVLDDDAARACAAAHGAAADGAAGAQCAALRSQRRGAIAALLEGAARVPGAPRGAEVARVLENATQRFALELGAMARQAAYVRAVHAAPGGCAAVRAPISAALGSLSAVLLTHALRAHTDRLLALLGEPAVSASELAHRPKGPNAGARGGQPRSAAAAGRRLEPSSAAGKGVMPRAWKADLVSAFVFNPSWYGNTSAETRAQLEEGAVCSRALHEEWLRRAPGVLGLADDDGRATV